MIDCTVIILTKNEELNITDCINSLNNKFKRVVVVDSFSDDNTTSISKNLGAEIYFNHFVNYGVQFQWALDNTNIETNWVFRFDADERLTPESLAEIEVLCEQNKETNVNGIIFKLELNFLGKKLKHGGTYPFKKLCIFKFGKAYMELREMDEQIVINSGKIIEMKSISKHEDYKDLTTWINKHNWYATRAVSDYFSHVNKKLITKNMDFPSKLRRLLKYKIYYKLPMRFRAWSYFIYRYLFRLGFLDGKEGFYYAFFQAYWYRLLIDAKILEKIKKEKCAEK